MLFTEKSVIENLASKALGIRDYEVIIKSFNNTNIYKDVEFQKKYNSFYRVRRNKEWQIKYYKFFEENKSNKNISIEKIMRCLYVETGKVELSFSSKMLATINPKKPIFDSVLSDYTNLKLKQISNKDNKLKNAIELYYQLEEWYDEYIKTDKAEKMIEVFDSILPSFKWIEPIKKIDFIIWGTY